MKKRRFRALLAALSITALAASSVSVLAAPPATASTDPIPFVVDARALPSGAGVAGALNLTDIGDLDWVHLTGDGSDRKDATPLIDVANLNPDGPTSSFSDSPYSYLWSDGTPTQSSTGVTTGKVFNYDMTTVGATNDFEAGYRVSVPAADSLRRLILVGGLWQAEAQVSVSANASESARFATSLSATGNARVKLYTVTIRPGQAAVFTAKMTQKHAPHGNLSLAAVALQEVGGESAVTLSTQPVPTAMNLTAEGAIDWLHLDGPTINRKANVTEVLTAVNRASATQIKPQSDNPATYSWSDGTPLAVQSGTTRGGVFVADSDDFSNPYGWDLTVAADPRPRSLTFVAGTWNADAEVSVKVNGAAMPTTVNSELVAGGSPVSRQFTVELLAGDSAVISAQLTRRSHASGNVTLGGVALAERVIVGDPLGALIDEIRAADLAAADVDVLDQLDRQLAEAIVLHSDPAATAEELRVEYALLLAAYDAARHSAIDAQYTFASNPGLASSFGWEGDRHAPIAFIDGSYRLRDHDNQMVTFGVPAVAGKISWRNAEGYLPAFISEYSHRGLDVAIQSFADEAIVGAHRFEIAYSRMTTTNTTGEEMRLPVVSSGLIPLNDAGAKMIGPGETVVRDFAIGADRFTGTYAWPTDAEIKALGGYDAHYEHMRDYWNDRLSGIAEITALPNPELVNAYKAGYIYTLIIRDDIEDRKELHVGENGYDKMFDHDTIGIVASLLTIGDFTFAKDYLESLPAQLQYDDAKWKYSWPYALYLQRTGDIDFIRSQFDNIMTQTHMVEADRIDGGTGIMKQTYAIDSNGFWTIDNWSALAGLSTYQYLADQLGESAEAQWAKAEYADLQAVVTARLQQTIDEFGLDYIPISMIESNEAGPRSDPRDANWASMFLFGRWAWDGYLFGADQSGIMLDWIDQTYSHGFESRAGISDTIYNFGGYPHGYYSSAYNAGYGSTALRGEQYRDSGIRAYEFMIDHAMSGPFGWWEGVNYPNANSPWDIDHAAGGGGSNQHMWGQSTATKVLFDALIAQKSDGTVIIGRGVPADWNADGQRIALDRYPVVDGGHLGFSMNSTESKIDLTFTGDVAKVGDLSVELIALKDNIESVAITDGAFGTGARASAPEASIDCAAGVVRLPAGTTAATIVMKSAVVPVEPGGPGSTGEPGAPRTENSGLATTGSNVAWIVGVAFILVAVGGSIMVYRRRAVRRGRSVPM